jgi:NADPH:quinone reductase-like Zn-dependent oxidoreductase
MQLVEVPEPEPRRGQVRIRVHAAAINPTDIGLREDGDRSGRMTGPPPWIPGMDLGGVIESAPEDSGFEAGDRVMAIVVPVGTRTGAQADYVVTPAESVVKIPNDLTFAAASTLPMNGMTARLALDELNLPVGSVVAVTGGAGQLSSCFIPLAKERGLAIIADAAPRDADLVRSFGADIVVARGDDFVTEVREAYPSGVHALVDTAVVGGPVIDAVRDGGVVISVRPWDGPFTRGIDARMILVGPYSKNTQALRDVADAVARGVITPRVAQVFTPTEFAEAYRVFEAGGVRGRVVLDFSDGL